MKKLLWDFYLKLKNLVKKQRKFFPSWLINFFSIFEKIKASMHGFVAWFDVLFRGSGKEKEVILSTKPGLK